MPVVGNDNDDISILVASLTHHPKLDAVIAKYCDIVEFARAVEFWVAYSESTCWIAILRGSEELIGIFGRVVYCNLRPMHPKDRLAPEHRYRKPPRPHLRQSKLKD